MDSPGGASGRSYTQPSALPRISLIALASASALKPAPFDRSMWQGLAGAGPPCAYMASFEQVGSTVSGEPLTAYVESARSMLYGGVSNPSIFWPLLFEPGTPTTNV